MKALRILRNYYFYCGIEKEEYDAIKKDVYASNFFIWRILHFFMASVFLALYISSLMNRLLKVNSIFYLMAFLYAAAGIAVFFLCTKESRVAKLIMYLSMSLLFIFGCFISKNNPSAPATTFIALLLITPMFMIDRPIYMTIELCAASTMFLIWMHAVKPAEIWAVDVINVIIFTVVGIFLNIIADSVRIREFVLARKLSIQKDTDELTSLKNKGALIREVNTILRTENAAKGVLYVMDVDKFKSINDTFGHDVGDDVIVQFGSILAKLFTKGEIAARFGGDEFVVFVRDVADEEQARTIADGIINGAAEVILPTVGRKMSVSIGAALRTGQEQDFNEIFKKADASLYRAKADAENRFCIHGE